MKKNHQTARAMRHGKPAHLGKLHKGGGKTEPDLAKDGVHGHFKKGGNK